MPISRPILLTVALVGLFAPCPLPAQTPSFGQVAASFGFAPSRLLADPVRPRMYAAVPATNSVAVIDTHTLQVVASVYIGPNPVDMSISPDGNTLYTANADSTTAAIGVLDLNTLQTLPSLALPGTGFSIGAGLGGRLYVSTIGDNGGLLQVDGASGTVQGTLDTGDYPVGYLQISPDGKTLYNGTGGIQSFDVSTPTAALLQSNGNSYDTSVESLRLSHDGHSICGPSTEYSLITLYSAGNLSAIYGEFDLGDDQPGPLAFSSDDALLYEVIDHTLHVYSTSTFVQTAHLAIPFAPGYDPDDEGESYDVYDLATDATDSFLFISQSNEMANGDNLVALATGRGPLTPPNPLPQVRITSDTPTISVGSGQTGHFTLTRTGDLSQPLTVFYTVGGSSDISDQINTLSGTKTFKAGKATAGIGVVPNSFYFYSTSGLLKLQLSANSFYSVTKAKAKITINP